MKIEILCKKLGVPIEKGKSKLSYYKKIRSVFLKTLTINELNKFQSPSITPSTHRQRSRPQNEKEYSVYQRADFTPLNTESCLNRMYKRIGDKSPQTLLFNSGMAAISTVMFYLMNTKKMGRLSIGENAYFETKWLAENYENLKYFNEYNPKIKIDSEVIWVEYPINCTQPVKYPFDKGLNLKRIFSSIVKSCIENRNKKIALVVDYTLYYLPFNIFDYFTELPENLEVYLITSLQKHRGYGLDLTNGGAVTFYPIRDYHDYEKLSRLRAIIGVSIPQETIWGMPKIKPRIINQLIKDSGANTLRIYKEISKNKFDQIRYYFSNNKDFLTSFIFIEIGKTLMKKSIQLPYLSDLLISEIINAAKINHIVLVHGTSFGLPFCRIFKNSERYENTNSLRLAVRYDEDLCNGVGKAIVAGINSFLKKYEK